MLRVNRAYQVDHFPKGISILRSLFIPVIILLFNKLGSIHWLYSPVSLHCNCLEIKLQD